MHEKKTRNFQILTYGCQMNIYDSDRLGALLRGRGWEATENREEADFIFVNTCSIREKAARRVIGHLKRLREMKLKNPALLLGVGGCVAEQEGKKLLDEVPWLNLVVGPSRLDEIPEIMETLSCSDRPVVLSGQGSGTEGPAAPIIPMLDKTDALSPTPGLSAPPRGGEAEDSKEVSPKRAGGSTNPSQALLTEEKLEKSGSRRILSLPPARETRPAPMSSFLTIMSGCDNYCAYCVVPYLRGPERSRPMEEVIAEARSLVARGSLEITLLGQNVNSYGRPGHRDGRDFAALLTEVSAIEGLKRLRFTTSHPKDFPDGLVALFGSLPNLCEHLHLPLQAGSDAVLANMGRRYTKEKYLALVSSLRKVRPELALSTDVIVGFPGETEEQFLETVSLLETVRFDSIYSFKYSDRPMTKANLMPGKIPEEEKAERLSRLQAVQKAVTLEIHQNLVGLEKEVLVEGFGRKPGQLSGRTRDMKIINFDGPANLLGQLVKVTVTEAWPVSLLGKMAT
ncbi:MAG: tRNA (N6-isopentenyl adenosine(37)-C2)-methylthiotransferase MiaB [Deltaproteobacteria bacterium]|jgi:tRNA-2-methylthio-N6-dimethylallyladenosine synthase|nr:tRNA (N6-isopentenyl adenosine(37)-C2)-methylthiotransferase MiaB [Deltaproteobacteria bacterium]